jgi:hypothetical protein
VLTFVSASGNLKLKEKMYILNEIANDNDITVATEDGTTTCCSAQTINLEKGTFCRNCYATVIATVKSDDLPASMWNDTKNTP